MFNIPDGLIKPGSETGLKFGFFSDLFGGYLWKDNQRILISMVISKKEGQGNLTHLFDAIEQSGYEIAVPTPLGKMKSILEKKGFVPTIEHDEQIGAVEVWVHPKQNEHPNPHHPA